jgi:hypothetical protein
MLCAIHSYNHELPKESMLMNQSPCFMPVTMSSVMGITAVAVAGGFWNQLRLIVKIPKV